MRHTQQQDKLHVLFHHINIQNVILIHLFEQSFQFWYNYSIISFFCDTVIFHYVSTECISTLSFKHQTEK